MNGWTVNDEYTRGYDDALKDLKPKIVAAKALIKKLDEITEYSSYKGIWGFLHVHGYKYDGPNWQEELEALKEALKNVQV
jgi:hypothetical protein